MEERNKKNSKTIPYRCRQKMIPTILEGRASCKKGYKMPDAEKWELKSMDKSDIPQQENVAVVVYLFACT